MTFLAWSSGTVLVITLAAWLTTSWMARQALNALQEYDQVQGYAWVTYWGGSRDGEREWLPASCLAIPVTQTRAVAVSPWGDEPQDVLRIIPVGTYLRDGNLLRWKEAV